MGPWVWEEQSRPETGAAVRLLASPSCLRLPGSKNVRGAYRPGRPLPPCGAACAETSQSNLRLRHAKQHKRGDDSPGQSTRNWSASHRFACLHRARHGPGRGHPAVTVISRSTSAGAMPIVRVRDWLYPYYGEAGHAARLSRLNFGVGEHGTGGTGGC